MTGRGWRAAEPMCVRAECSPAHPPPHHRPVLACPLASPVPPSLCQRARRGLVCCATLGDIFYAHFLASGDNVLAGDVLRRGSPTADVAAAERAFFGNVGGTAEEGSGDHVVRRSPSDGIEDLFGHPASPSASPVHSLRSRVVLVEASSRLLHETTGAAQPVPHDAASCALPPPIHSTESALPGSAAFQPPLSMDADEASGDDRVVLADGADTEGGSGIAPEMDVDGMTVAALDETEAADDLEDKRPARKRARFAAGASPQAYAYLAHTRCVFYEDPISTHVGSAAPSPVRGFMGGDDRWSMY